LMIFNYEYLSLDWFGWLIIFFCPSAHPWQLFFSRGRNILFKISGRGILRGGAYAPPVLNQGVHMHSLPHGSARLWF
jgi:hypothetical protein